MYTVEVTREDGVWIADVVDLPGAHTHARNLESLAENVHEVIALVRNDPGGTQYAVAYEYQGLGHEFLEALALGRQRAELESRQRELGERTVVMAERLAREGWSVRDIGGALGITPGRISQLLSKPQRRAG